MDPKTFAKLLWGVSSRPRPQSQWAVLLAVLSCNYAGFAITRSELRQNLAVSERSIREALEALVEKKQTIIEDQGLLVHRSFQHLLRKKGEMPQPPRGSPRQFSAQPEGNSVTADENSGTADENSVTADENSGAADENSGAADENSGALEIECTAAHCYGEDPQRQGEISQPKHGILAQNGAPPPRNGARPPQFGASAPFSRAAVKNKDKNNGGGALMAPFPLPDSTRLSLIVRFADRQCGIQTAAAAVESIIRSYGQELMIEALEQFYYAFVLRRRECKNPPGVLIAWCRAPEKMDPLPSSALRFENWAKKVVEFESGNQDYRPMPAAKAPSRPIGPAESALIQARQRHAIGSGPKPTAEMEEAARQERQTAAQSLMNSGKPQGSNGSSDAGGNGKLDSGAGA